MFSKEDEMSGELYARNNSPAILGRRQPSAFSMVELLVVIGIIAILMSLLMASLRRAREQANAVVCANNLRQLAIGINNYASRGGGWMPSWSGWQVFPDGSSVEDHEGLGWTEQLVPSIGVLPSSSLYSCPSFPIDKAINYFIGARWASVHGQNAIKLSSIRKSTEYILSGDCTAREEYCPPFGISVRVSDDCDKDDALFKQLVFADEPNGINIHRLGNNVLFSDGHVQCHRRFDISIMTYDCKDMRKWEDVVQ